jgi:hypothetical protein
MSVAQEWLQFEPVEQPPSKDRPQWERMCRPTAQYPPSLRIDVGRLESRGTANTNAQLGDKSEQLETPWLEKVILRGRDAYDVEEITGVVGAIENLMRKRQFGLLGGAIAALPLSRLSSHVLVSILRVSSAAAPQIPGWANSLSRIEQDLSGRNLDARKLLRGLF